MAAFFYADDGILILHQPARLQVALDVLMRLVDRVGIQTNINNMVGMVCKPCNMSGGHLEVAYVRRMMGVGLYFWEQECNGNGSAVRSEWWIWRKVH